MGLTQGPSPAPQVLVPVDLVIQAHTSGPNSLSRIKAKGFEKQAAKTKPQTSSRSLSLWLGGGGAGRGKGGNTNLWKTAEQSLHTDVWLSKGNSTSPSLQSSHTKPLAWHRWGWGGSKSVLLQRHLKPGHTTLPALGAG